MKKIAKNIFSLGKVNSQEFKIYNAQTGSVETLNVSKLTDNVLMFNGLYAELKALYTNKDGKFDRNEAIQYLLDTIASENANSTELKGIGLHLADGEFVANFNNRINKSNRFINNNAYVISNTFKCDYSDVLLHEYDNLRVEVKNALNSFKTANNTSLLITSFYFSRLIANLLEVNPHVLVTGPAGSGKTKLQETLHNLIPISIMTGDASKAGVADAFLNVNGTLLLNDFEIQKFDASNFSDVLLNSFDKGNKALRSNQSRQLIEISNEFSAVISNIDGLNLPSALQSRTADVVLAQNKVNAKDAHPFVKFPSKAKDAGQKLMSFISEHLEEIYNVYLAVKDELSEIVEIKTTRQATIYAQLIVGYILSEDCDLFNNNTVDVNKYINNFLMEVGYEQFTVKESDVNPLNIVTGIKLDDTYLSLSSLISIIREQESLLLNNKQNFFNEIMFEAKNAGLYIQKDHVKLVDGDIAQRIKKTYNLEPRNLGNILSGEFVQAKNSGFRVDNKKLAYFKINM